MRRRLLLDVSGGLQTVLLPQIIAPHPRHNWPPLETHTQMTPLLPTKPIKLIWFVELNMGLQFLRFYIVWKAGSGRGNRHLLFFTRHADIWMFLDHKVSRRNFKRKIQEDVHFALLVLLYGSPQRCVGHIHNERRILYAWWKAIECILLLQITHF